MIAVGQNLKVLGLLQTFEESAVLSDKVCVQHRWLQFFSFFECLAIEQHGGL